MKLLFSIAFIFTSLTIYSQLSFGTTLNTASYDAFGLMVKVSDTESIYFYREGTEHVGTNIGKIKAVKYNYQNNSWSSPWDIFDDVNLDDRNIAGGLNSTGDKIILHFTQYDADNNYFLNIQTLISDDLSGASGTWTLLSNPLFENNVQKAGFSPHGHNITLNNGDILQGWYIREGTDDSQYGPYRMYAMRSADNGQSWDLQYSTIYADSSYYIGEPFIEDLGGDTLVCIARSNALIDDLYTMVVIFSYDNGATWEPYTFTNLSSDYHILPYTYYDQSQETIVCSVLHRGVDEFKLYSTSKEDIISRPDSCWSFIETIDTGFRYNGYASMVEFEEGNYFSIYAKQVTLNDCDTYSFIWRNNITSSKNNPEEPLIKLYPNPTRNTIEISSEDTNQKGIISVYNIEGQLLLQNDFHGKQKNSLDLSSFNSGIYFVKINLNNNISIHKAIKN